ncbi:hypothetical protein XENOCAPTIV_012766 [Xenoophorus captivus]|uniref:Uncharacterized protein n=1 Tax=Xenoophorus captivus TaxID=1517983 RepID=A0ABV0QLS7_9TELE
MGPASDLRQKECPRLLSRPAPLAALHTVIRTGAFVFTFETPNCRAEATDQTSERVALLCSPLSQFSGRCLTNRLFQLFILPPKSNLESSLESLTHCADSIPLHPQPVTCVC